LDQARFLAVGEVYDVSLRGVGVGIFELEHLVDAILFESGELDKKTQQSRQISADD
jgi:hypothetical protein